MHGPPENDGSWMPLIWITGLAGHYGDMNQWPRETAEASGNLNMNGGAPHHDAVCKDRGRQQEVDPADFRVLYSHVITH